MRIDMIPVGDNPPENLNVIIEVPTGGEPVKYEFDKASGALFVDRILHTPMRYPTNYGFIPHTLSPDGDPLDALVILPEPVLPGVIVPARVLGVFKMTDEAGSDEKILAVPVEKVFGGYAHVDDLDKVSGHWLERIGHFFEHYKDLEKGKWVKVEGWEGADAARAAIIKAAEAYQK